MPDHLFRGSLAELDPESEELSRIEAERQARKLILIPSESAAPLAVRGLSSAFHLCRRLPDDDGGWRKTISDYDIRLLHYQAHSILAT
jgi:glycine hydroxymethyltransferase